MYMHTYNIHARFVHGTMSAFDFTVTVLLSDGGGGGGGFHAAFPNQAIDFRGQMMGPILMRQIINATGKMKLITCSAVFQQ